MDSLATCFRAVDVRLMLATEASVVGGDTDVCASDFRTLQHNTGSCKEAIAGGLV